MKEPQTNTFRTKLSLDGIWQFRVEKAEDDPREWGGGFDSNRLVAVPASFNEQFTDYETFNHMGKVWYAREFEVPQSLAGQHLELYFSAVNYIADVYLNGEHLGRHETGYTPFSFGLGSVLQAGTNTLVVCVDCELTPETVPQGGFDKAAIPGLTSPFRPSVNFDFFPYSGIHRSVYLCATPTERLLSVYIDPEIEGADGLLQIRGTVTAGVESVSVRSIESGECEQFTVSEDGAFEGLLRIPDARLWGIYKPELYHLEFESSNNGEVVDRYTQRCGIRTVRVEGDQLLLNGEPIYLTGFGK
ncbi:sugar-binding domain-containing protein [Coraliomargarita parva]|uniref:sugar-binding domain-containing protein n=1 Tax=Coraliomargarita parva TaxID=3014050 RepID=UPI0022B4EA6C|nr:sugar-binding domain-containing protein [Coraliomargarita parva]